MTMARGTGSTPARDDFYVGYLPTPQSHKKMLKIVVPALLLMLGVGAALIAWAQRDPGAAVWSDASESFTGVLLATPAPMLIVTPADTGREATLLLVEEGKHGAQERAAHWDGQRVTITGRVLGRDGRTVVELVSGEVGVRAAPTPPDSPHQPPATSDTKSSAQRVNIRGEIIDSKCFHGAMKPGDGKAHKACATLCIGNGIAPILAAMDEHGSMQFCLLVLADGSPLDEDTMSKIGEPVEVSGDLTTIGDLRVLAIAPGSVKRTGG